MNYVNRSECDEGLFGAIMYSALQTWFKVGVNI